MQIQIGMCRLGFDDGTGVCIGNTRPGRADVGGVRTFLGAPYIANLDDVHADFVVLGVPFDEGTWGWPGERYGPRAMRESSQEYNHDLIIRLLIDTLGSAFK